MNDLKKYVAELVGTFGLVFFGTGAIIVDQETQGTITHVGIAITFGLIVSVIIYALGEISGAHINPAVTVAFTFSGRFPSRHLIPYLISQIAGAVLASLILSLVFPENEMLGSTTPRDTEVQSIILEFFLTFFLMLVIMHVATGSKEQGLFAGVAIGFTVLLEAMFAGPITGASMNPARSFGPSIVSGHLTHLWIYLLAPIVGAVCAIPVWKYLAQNK